jgi:putative transposase
MDSVIPWNKLVDLIKPYYTHAETGRKRSNKIRFLPWQEFPHLRKKFWGRHLWARGYLAVSSGTITDEMIRAYIDEQEGEQVADDSRFPIDKHLNPSASSRG